MEILKEIQIEENHGISSWKDKLENAVRACNEEKYYELINISNG